MKHESNLHLEVLFKADKHVSLTGSIEGRAKSYESEGLKPLDALHLAAAVEQKVDYFCTCDDSLLKRAKQINTQDTKVKSPIELISEIEK